MFMALDDVNVFPVNALACCESQVAEEGDGGDQRAKRVEDPLGLWSWISLFLNCGVCVDTYQGRPGAESVEDERGYAHKHCNNPEAILDHGMVAGEERRYQRVRLPTSCNSWMSGSPGMTVGMGAMEVVVAAIGKWSKSGSIIVRKRKMKRGEGKEREEGGKGEGSCCRHRHFGPGTQRTQHAVTCIITWTSKHRVHTVGLFRSYRLC